MDMSAYAKPEEVGHVGCFLDISKLGPKNVHPPDFTYPTIPDVELPVVTKPDKEVPQIEGSMSQGTVAQLMSIGPQDRFLSLNPQMTFFRQVYRRHTNFAVECIEEQFSKPEFAFGGLNVCKLGKHGDLIGNMTLQIALPNLGIAGGRWVDAVGYVLLAKIRLRIGDLVIQTHERLWYDIEDKLFLTDAHRSGLDAMIGRGTTLATDAAHTLHVPLKFFCCDRNSGRQQFVPVARLGRTVDIGVEIDAESLENLVAVPPGTALPPATASALLLVDNVYLDAIERTRFATGPSQYMFEIVQDMDQLSYIASNGGNFPTNNVTVDLRELNMPVKYLAGVVYAENYETNFEYLDEIESATFMIAAQQQFDPRPSAYFSLQQTYEHFVRSETSNVFAYSFAIHAGAWQPNGSLNFAVLSNPSLRFILKNASSAPLKVKVFASCINWVTFAGGMCALRYDS